MIPTLRPYQHDVIQRVREALRKYRRVLVVMPTGAGKTLTSAFMAGSAVQKGNRVAFIAHRRELLKQTAKSYSEVGIPVGIVSAGVTGDRRQPVQVCGVQTMANRLDMIGDFGVMIWDECIDGESIIETDIGPVKIKDVPDSGAEFVRSFSNEKIVYAPIGAWRKTGFLDTITLHLENGSHITCTEDHLIYSGEEWKKAQQFRVGDLVKCAPAVAGSLPFDTAMECFENTLMGIFRNNLKKDGPKHSHPMSRKRRFAPAVAGKKQSPRTKHLKNLSAPRAAGAMFATYMATTSGPTDGIPACRIASAKRSLARFSATLACCSRTSGQETRGFVRRMALFKRNGRNTSQASCEQLASKLASRPLPDMANILSHQFQAAFPNLPNCTPLHIGAARSWSHAIGSTKSAMSALLGGFAMTERPSKDRNLLRFILRGIPRRKQKSFANGSMTGTVNARSSVTMDTPILELIRKQPKGFSVEYFRTFQNACATSSKITLIEHSGRRDVFDISVPKTGCFFANGILVHNCHHVASASYTKIFDHYPNARHIGLTATPERLDGAGLGKYFDAIVEGPSVSWLIENGFLSPYRMFAPSSPDLQGVRTTAGDYNRADAEAAMSKPQIIGDAVQHYMRLAPGKRNMVFCASVKHSLAVVEKFQSAGLIAAHIDGETEQGQRDRLIEDFAAGRIQVLSSVDLVSEGFDLPSIEVATLLRPTKSLSLYLQQVGRVLRTYPGKSEAIILDHAGNSARHGLPDDERQWSLQGRAKRRKSAITSDEPDVQVKQCPTCYSVHRPAPCCPRCGFEYPVQGRTPEEVEGELQEIARREASKERKREQGQAETLEDLIRVAKLRGYKHPEHWAKHVFQARQKKHEAA